MSSWNISGFVYELRVQPSYIVPVSVHLQKFDRSLSIHAQDIDKKKKKKKIIILTSNKDNNSVENFIEQCATVRT